MRGARSGPVSAPTAEPLAAVDRRIPAVVRRNTLLLATSQAIVGSGSQMVPTLTGLMIEQLLRSATFSGLGYSVVGASRFLIAYPLGALSDRRGRRPAMLVGLSLSLVGAIGLGAAQILQSFALFGLALVVFGLGVGAAQQLRLAAADMFPPRRRAEGLGIVLTGSLVGVVGGPLLIAAAQTAAPRLGIDAIATAWLLVPGLVVPVMLLVALIRPDPRDIALDLARYYPPELLRESAPAPAAARPSFGALFASYPRRVAFANSAAAQGTMSLMMSLTPISLAHHGHGLQEISLAVALHVLGMFAFSLPLGRLCDRFGRRIFLLVGGAISAVGAVMVPLDPGFWVPTAGLFLVGVGWSCTNVASSAVIADTSAPAERGRAVGANDTLAGAAAILTPALGGLLVQTIGPASLGIASIALLAGPFLMAIPVAETSPAARSDAA